MSKEIFKREIKKIPVGETITDINISVGILTVEFSNKKFISLKTSQIYELDIIKFAKLKNIEIKKIQIMQTGLFINGQLILESYSLL